MSIKKMVSVALILATGCFFCLVTSGCSKTNNSITIQKESRFKQLQRKTQNPRIVYLGGEYDYGTNISFGPSDVNFEVKGLR